MKNAKTVFASITGAVNSASCLLGLVLLLAVFGLTACKPIANQATPADVSGTYTLTTVAGKPLPTTPPHEGGAPEVTSGSITLNADGSFVGAMSYRLPDGKAMNRDFTGSYQQAGARLTLQWKGAGTTSATVETNTFTMNNEGVLFAYRK